MIAAGGMFLAIISLLIVFFHAQVGVLFLLTIKPIIDATWQNKLLIFSALEIVGAGLPAILIFRFSAFHRRKDFPFLSIWLFYLLSNVIGSTMMIVSGKYLGSIDNFLRVLNGFIGFYMLMLLYSDKVWFRRMLIAIMIAGLFPMFMGLYQAATGKIWRVRQTIGIVRNVGLYHDAFSFRSYAFMTLTGIILYWEYFLGRKILPKLIFSAYASVCLIVLYKVYSKAGVVILGIWILVWSILNKKYFRLLVILSLLILINFATQNKIFTEIGILFSKETAAADDTGDQKYILSGRLTVWEDYWQKYVNGDILQKLFGLGASGGSAHNDYLRVLVSGGIIGLTMYLILLIFLGLQVFKNVLLHKTPLNVMALMIFLMWMVDTIGLSPGIYPAYQWYVWGFIGLSIKGVVGLDSAEMKAVSQAPAS